MYGRLIQINSRNSGIVYWIKTIIPEKATRMDGGELVNTNNIFCSIIMLMFVKYYCSGYKILFDIIQTGLTHDTHSIWHTDQGDVVYIIKLCSAYWKYRFPLCMILKAYTKTNMVMFV